MEKIGEVFSGGFKVGDLYSTDDAAGFFALILTPLVVLALIGAAIGWLIAHPVAFFGVLLYCVGAFFGVRGLILAVRDRDEPGDELAFMAIAGIIAAVVGVILLFSSPMDLIFIIALIIIYTGNILPD